ncbi:UDP-4-amino-4-deoxy-L-arabinose--oxoglutarate aminotransferase [bacterium HR35]|nr:UDP-4-amino-4-deoxy-L-arabinose--oxoglutarate aminotransferase [bacterium HR35]
MKYKIPILRPFMPKGIINKLRKVLYSGWIGEGPVVKQFEQALKDYLGNRYIVSVNSGTSALWIAYHLAGIKKGDVVITTPLTCSATNIPLLHLGAKIVWADIDINTGNIDPLDVENKVKKIKKVKAIVIVDYGGMPCDMDRLIFISKKYKIPIIEDAAQALGAEYKGIKIGNHNDYVCFSFQAVKTITTVDGGALCLKNRKDYERAKNLGGLVLIEIKNIRRKNPGNTI